MGKLKDLLTIDTVDEVYQYVNSFNEIQKCKRHMLERCADCDDANYHAQQDHMAMERAKNKGVKP